MLKKRALLISISLGLSFFLCASPYAKPCDPDVSARLQRLEGSGKTMVQNCEAAGEQLDLALSSLDQQASAAATTAAEGATAVAPAHGSSPVATTGAKATQDSDAVSAGLSSAQQSFTAQMGQHQEAIASLQTRLDTMKEQANEMGCSAEFKKAKKQLEESKAACGVVQSAGTARSDTWATMGGLMALNTFGQALTGLGQGGSGGGGSKDKPGLPGGLGGNLGTGDFTPPEMTFPETADDTHTPEKPEVLRPENTNQELTQGGGSNSPVTTNGAGGDSSLNTTSSGGAGSTSGPVVAAIDESVPDARFSNDAIRNSLGLPGVASAGSGASGATSGSRSGNAPLKAGATPTPSASVGYRSSDGSTDDSNATKKAHESSLSEAQGLDSQLSRKPAALADPSSSLFNSVQKLADLALEERGGVRSASARERGSTGSSLLSR